MCGPHLMSASRKKTLVFETICFFVIKEVFTLVDKSVVTPNSLPDPQHPNRASPVVCKD